MDTFETVRLMAKENFSTANWWVGATDRESEGTWLWKESRINLPNNSAMWASGQPSGANAGGGVQQDCGYLVKAQDYKLDDVGCNWRKWAGLERFPLCKGIPGTK